MSVGDGLSYVARQGFRVAWYMAHAAAARDFARRHDPAPKAERRPVVTFRELREDLLALFRRDLRNAAAGLYPMPRDVDGLPTLLHECLPNGRNRHSN
jgi:hypothetical protein